MAVQQKARTFQRISCDRDDAGFLFLRLAVGVHIDDAVDLAGSVVLDPHRHAVRANFEIAGRLTFGNLGVKRRPLGAGLAALEAEADLLACAAPVARLTVDRHSSGVDFLVAELARAGLHHFEIVVAGQARNAVGARRAHLELGLGVPRLHLGERYRPVEQVGAGDVAINRFDLELVFIEAQRRTGPVHGRAADRLDDPGRQIGEVMRDPPASRSGAHILPGQLDEAVPLVIDEILHLVPVAGLEDHDLDALLGEFIAERATARAGADDHDQSVIVEVEFCHGFLPQLSQSMSLKPRLM